MTKTINQQLEQYTIENPGEVLLIRVEIKEEEDEIAIYRGFSSSLMRPTSPDPDIPVLPEEAIIISIDRLVSPYNPENPQYIQQGLTWNEMQSLLTKASL